jgi:hypothetical protein
MLPTSKKYTEAQVRQLYADIMDTNKVQLVCGKHNYLASEKPPTSVGCKNCWEAWWWHKIATTPAHLRAERIEQATAMLRHANEAYERGEFDFEPLARPEIHQTTEPD